MPAKNGHDTAAPDVGFGGPLALGEAVDAAGGVWIGSNTIKAHLAQIEQQRQIQATAIRVQALWQAEVASYRTQADAAEELSASRKATMLALLRLPEPSPWPSFTSSDSAPNEAQLHPLASGGHRHRPKHLSRQAMQTRP